MIISQARPLISAPPSGWSDDYSLLFDTNQRGDLPANAWGDVYFISFWFKVPDLTDRARLLYFGETGTSSNTRRMAISVINKANVNHARKLQVYYRDVNSGSAQINALVGNPLIVENAWTHVVTAHGTGGHKIWIDGTLITSGNVTYAQGSAAETSFIPDFPMSWTSNTIAYNQKPDEYLDGYINHLVAGSINSNAIDPSQLYNGGVPNDPTTHAQAAGYSHIYNFEEGAGSTVADEVGTEDITLINSPTWSSDTP